MTLEKDGVLNVCFCFTDSSGSYYKHPLVSLTSVFENTKNPVRAHLICDETLTEQARESFQRVAAHYGQEVIIHTAPAVPPSVNTHVSALFGPGSLYRLFMPELIQERLVLYLDCDTVCTMDISDVFATPMDALPAAGALDIGQHDDDHSIQRIKSLGLEPDRYINSGVILFNLDIIRQKYSDYKLSIFASISQKQYKFPDQDAVNVYFQNRTINASVLPEEYNYFIGIADRPYDDISACNGKILHYTREKPWDKFYPAALPYWKYYAIAFSCAEAFRGIESLGKYQYAHLISFVLRNRRTRKMVNRLWQISEQGILETLLDRLIPSRRRKKRLFAGKQF